MSNKPDKKLLPERATAKLVIAPKFMGTITSFQMWRIDLEDDSIQLKSEEGER